MIQDPSAADNPLDPNYAVDDADNRRRQALSAVVLEHYDRLANHLERDPDSVLAVTMAHQLLAHVRERVQGPVADVIDVSRWWSLQQGSSFEFVQYLSLKAEALRLLEDMFASLERLGLRVQHERP